MALPIKKLASYVREERVSKGLTQKQYAKQLGISVRTLRRVETAKPEALKNPTIPESQNSINFFSEKTQRALYNAGFKNEIEKETKYIPLKSSNEVSKDLELIQKGLGYSNKELSEKLGVSKSTIYRWKNGKVKDFSKIKNVDKLRKLRNKAENKSNVIYQIVYKQNGQLKFTRKRNFEETEETISRMLHVYKLDIEILGIRKTYNV